MTALVKRDREFNADVSHELRTPLAVIRGAVELMQANPDLAPKQKQRLDRIERAARQCADLTTALLLLSRNERGTGRTELCRVCQALIEDNRAQLAGKPVNITLSGRTDVFVEAPEAVVAVALGNLVGNACKYTHEHGRIQVSLEVDAGFVTLRVADNGIGLAPDLVPRMKGTNEELGRKILADSGLPIISANNMAEAAEKVVAAAKGR